MWIDNLSLAEACLGGEYSYGTILIVTGSFVQSKQLIQKLLGMPVRTLIWLKESVWTQEKSKIPVLNCGGEHTVFWNGMCSQYKMTYSFKCSFCESD